MENDPKSPRRKAKSHNGPRVASVTFRTYPEVAQKFKILGTARLEAMILRAKVPENG